MAMMASTEANGSMPSKALWSTLVGASKALATNNSTVALVTVTIPLEGRNRGPGATTRRVSVVVWTAMVIPLLAALAERPASMFTETIHTSAVFTNNGHHAA